MLAKIEAKRRRIGPLVGLGVGLSTAALAFSLTYNSVSSGRIAEAAPPTPSSTSNHEKAKTKQLEIIDCDSVESSTKKVDGTNFAVEDYFPLGNEITQISFYGVNENNEVGIYFDNGSGKVNNQGLVEDRRLAIVNNKKLGFEQFRTKMEQAKADSCKAGDAFIKDIDKNYGVGTGRYIEK